MTSSNQPNHHHTETAQWIEPHRAAFLGRLASRGYSAFSIRRYERTIERFCAAMERCANERRHLDGAMLERVRAVVLAGAFTSDATYAAYRLDQFVASLVEAGVATRPQPAAHQPTRREVLRAEFTSYLRVQRGLRESTINHCLYNFERFMTDRFGDEGMGDLNAITPEGIVAFCRKLRCKAWPSHLRNLFEFLFWSGKTRHNLATSIPRVAHGRAANLPRYVRPEVVQQLVDAARSDDALGRRDHAMLLLLARLGLRAPEVVAIQLEDIDWRAGEILIRGKGGRHERVPLPSAVGEAIVDYIQNGRAGDSRALFVSHRAPHQPFKDAQTINDVLQKAFAKTGLKPPQKYIGSHLLRHSLATAMLGGGASLEEIGHVLRHRSRVTTTIYAKCDLETLRSIAQCWPAEGGAQ